MGWAIFWAFVFGGATGAPDFNGWAAVFGFALSMGWVLYNEMERKAVDLHNKNISLQNEIDRLQSQQNKKPRQEYDPSL